MASPLKLCPCPRMSAPRACYELAASRASRKQAPEDQFEADFGLISGSSSAVLRLAAARQSRLLIRYVRWEKLVAEDRTQPLLVPFVAPASVGDQQPVHLRRREGVDDVNRVALSKPAPQGARPSECVGDAALTFVTLASDVG